LDGKLHRPVVVEIAEVPLDVPDVRSYPPLVVFIVAGQAKDDPDQLHPRIGLDGDSSDLRPGLSQRIVDGAHS